MSNKQFTAGAKYAALILVLVAVAAGVTVYLTHRGGEQVQEASIQEPLVENLAASTQAAQPSDASAPSASVSTVPSKLPDTTQATQGSQTASAGGALKTALPVTGDTIGVYAMDCLSYNETTRDWRVH
ncbi:MAG: hypothetical protein ACI3XG_01970, partial [Faecousia sp.]